MVLPRRPYLLRAMYEWLLDSNLTPYIIVNASCKGTRVPMQFVQDNQIILNITPNVVGNFSLNNEEIRFNARFSGVPHQIIVPMAAVIAIYAKENGAGMMFEPEEAYEEQNTASVDSPDDEPPSPPKGRPVFKVVK